MLDRTAALLAGASRCSGGGHAACSVAHAPSRSPCTPTSSAAAPAAGPSGAARSGGATSSSRTVAASRRLLLARQAVLDELAQRLLEARPRQRRLRRVAEDGDTLLLLAVAAGVALGLGQSPQP